VRRTLGIAAHRGKINESVNYEVAVKLAAAMHMDPADAGV
jgi:hypothetical protein